MASSNGSSKDELSGASSEEDLAQVGDNPSLTQEWESVRLHDALRTPNGKNHIRVKGWVIQEHGIWMGFPPTRPIPCLSGMGIPVKVPF
jgi:hypothetical protein